ncbi:hypothetical protein Tco_0242202 [Tanacetum coccineum]|uniref:Uncharacterized protein n=1 Tax=Tanacetum coccineum TaxID=301880 RepID=A0ABQ4X7C4_9ASTR
MSYEDIRLIFERVWDQNHAFVPKDSEIEKEQPAEEEKEKKNDDSQQQAGSSKKRSREDSDEDNAKKQKLEDDAEKEELRDSMDVVLRDDIAIDVESLATKYPMVDWKTHSLFEKSNVLEETFSDEAMKHARLHSWGAAYANTPTCFKARLGSITFLHSAFRAELTPGQTAHSGVLLSSLKY